MIWFQGLAKPCRKPTLATSTHTHTNTQRKKEGKKEEEEEKYSSHKNVVVRDVDMSIEFVTNRLLPPLWLLFFNRRLQPWSTIRSYWTLNKWFPRVRHFAVIQISVSRFSVSPPIGFQHDQLFQRLRCFIRGAYSARAALLIRDGEGEATTQHQPVRPDDPIRHPDGSTPLQRLRQPLWQQQYQRRRRRR